MATDQFNFREATSDDLDAILDVCSVALGWTDPTFDRALFTWKHLDNAFGRSLLLVAEDDDGIAAVRPFMRWHFHDSSGETVAAARAVDTATHPRAHRMGLFRSLTVEGLTRLTESGTAFIFNTPNEQSLSGYLKMGWVDAGNVEFGYRIASPISSPLSLTRLARARTKAEKRSIPTPELGISIEDGLALLDPDEPCPRPGISQSLNTAHTLRTLRWRYGSAPMEYRFLPGPDKSGLIVRLRRRGAARELVVAERIGDLSNEKAGRSIRNVMRRVRADHAVGFGGLGGTVATDRPGPRLAIRAIERSPTRSDISFQVGDIEVF